MYGRLIDGARLEADAWSQQQEKEKGGAGGKEAKALRFDAFVLRYFKRSFGTRGIARRQLRSFVASLEAHAAGGGGGGGGDAPHPRVLLFCALSGVVSANEDGAYNSRLLPTYALPAMRAVLPETRQVRLPLELEWTTTAPAFPWSGRRRRLPFPGVDDDGDDDRVA